MKALYETPAVELVKFAAMETIADVDAGATYDPYAEDF